MHCLCAIISESRLKRVYTLQQQQAAAAVTTSCCGRLLYKGCSNWMMKKSCKHSLVRSFFSWGKIFWTFCMHNFVAVGVEKVAWDSHLSSWIAWVSQYSRLSCCCCGVYVCVCVRAPWSSCFWVRGIVDDDPWGGILCSWWGVGSVGRGRTGSTCRRSTPFAAAAAAAWRISWGNKLAVRSFVAEVVEPRWWGILWAREFTAETCVVE